jgi:signal recognition particle receptor subunit beta
MSFVNYHTKEINCKIVYYGPALGGKTTNIQQVYQKTSHSNKSKIVTLNTENDRTLFFDFLPLELGEIRGFNTRFHLYTVPGQVFYEASRKLILRGVDGIVFVADSQVEKLEANIDSFLDLTKNLANQGLDISSIPIVFQWNKRDLPNVTSIEDLQAKINKLGAPAFETIAVEGKERLQLKARVFLKHLKQLASLFF